MRKEKIGSSILCLCDCMKLMATLPDKSIDLAIIDPPYGSAGGGKVRHAMGGGRFAKYGDGAECWDIAPNKKFFGELFRVSHFQIIWGGNYFLLPPSKNFIIWHKLTISENFSMAMAEYAWTNIIGNAKIFSHHPQDKTRFHPCQKPVALYKWLLSKYAKPDWKILDTHFGSGSIAVACNEMGFSLIASEIDQDYFNAAVSRVKEANRQGDLFRAAV
jgi:site-specific DNA-methyltransferase (adenine-specific)